MSDVLDTTTGSIVLREENFVQIIPGRITLPTRVAITSTTARSGLLPTGFYEIVATTALYYVIGPSNIEAVAATAHPLAAFERLRVWIGTAAIGGYIAGIRSSADGSLAITRETTVI